MKLINKLNKKLPPLAWVVTVNGGITKLVHGEHVDVKENFFVEGAWSGEFNKGLFANAEWFCGTGGGIENKEILFSTPTHVTYGLYIFKKENVIFVSNSLYLLMAFTGLKMDSEYAGYEIDLNSIRKGVDKYTKKIRVLENGKVVYVKVIYYANLRVGSDGQYNVENKEISTPFKNFKDYYQKLMQAMIMLKDNGADKNRNKQYGVVSTISRGYDAPCCAVIAKKMGATTACTFSPKGKHKEDCGDKIAKKLGYENIIVRDSNIYKRNENYLEAEVVCTGELGSEISMASFYDVFNGNIVLTGERGDSIWDRNEANPNDRFIFESRDASLGSSERRLWVDYISCPLPLFGATAWPSITKISNSEEMKKWSLFNNYDRPIPRRIVEESGVLREEFGVKKQGAGFSYSYDWKSRIIKRMAKKTGEDFNNYLKENKKFHLFSSLFFLFKVRDIYLSRIGLHKSSCKDFSEIENTTVVRYLVPWAGEHMINRYKKAIEEQ